TLEALIALGHDGQMDVASLQSCRQAGPAIFHDANVDTGVTPSVTHQEIRQNAFDRLRRRTHPQRSGLSLLERARPFAKGLSIGQQSATSLKQVLSLSGQAEAAPNSSE